MKKPKNLSTFSEWLDAPTIEPGTICHLGICGNHVVDDWHFVSADDGRILFHTNCQTTSSDSHNSMQSVSWGDVIEFWPLLTVWILREEAGETSTTDKYRIIESRLKLIPAFVHLGHSIYPELKDEVSSRMLNFEQQRRAVLRFGRLLSFPVRLEE